MAAADAHAVRVARTRSDDPARPVVVLVLSTAQAECAGVVRPSPHLGRTDRGLHDGVAQPRNGARPSVSDVSTQTGGLHTLG